MENRAKLTEIDLVRGFAIIGVLLVHSTSYATIYMLNSSLFGVYNFFNIFFKIGTTSFIVLSSFVLFYNYFPQRLTVKRFKKFYRNRLMYVLVPYFIFSAGYFLLVWWYSGRTTGFPGMLSDFGYQLITGKAYMHLYFVFISIQLYLLFPILLFLFQRFRWLAASAILVGVTLQWGFFLWNREVLLVTNRGSWAPTYLGHYFLGAWLGVYFDRIKSLLIIAKGNFSRSRLCVWIALWLVWLGAGITYVTIYYRARLYDTLYHNAVYDLFWDLYTMMTPLVLIQAAFLLRGRMTNLWVGGLRHLGVVSFGVYLFHPLVLLAYRRFVPSAGDIPWIHHMWYAGGFLCALVISWVTVTLISRSSRWSWLLFGSVPAQLQASRKSRSESPAPSAPSVQA